MLEIGNGRGDAWPVGRAGGREGRQAGIQEAREMKPHRQSESRGGRGGQDRMLEKRTRRAVQEDMGCEQGV